MKKKIIYLTKSTCVPRDQYPKPDDVIHPSDNNKYFEYYNVSFIDEDCIFIENCSQRRDK